MKFFVINFLLFFINCSFASINAKVTYEKTENGYKILAYNSEYCPVSVKIEFKITNLKLNDLNNSIYVIPPQSKDLELTFLEIINSKKAYSISYSMLFNYGDATLKMVESTYKYNLPFKKNSSFEIPQGYNGKFSHQNQNAIDFNMPENTEIYPVREGIVVFVQQENSKTCQTKDCSKFNNYITVYHEDGTFSEYHHIKKNGALVKVGDFIKKNQVIAYSGNVGWSRGAHLHLVIFKQEIDKRVTLKTKFLTGDGKTAEYLQEKKTYLRNY